MTETDISRQTKGAMTQCRIRIRHYMIPMPMSFAGLILRTDALGYSRNGRHRMIFYTY